MTGGLRVGRTGGTGRRSDTPPADGKAAATQPQHLIHIPQIRGTAVRQSRPDRRIPMENTMESEYASLDVTDMIPAQKEE
ncbi:hypothetical protein, partial [Streptomyces sp. 1222.5]|uniref:hypothetical protein n=1 Tax=Streptomyces sp. 1222.5 TaxID=1881026 RepID=UPI003EBCFE41